MVGGNTSFGAGGWDQTVWDQLIPVKMSGDRPNSLGQGYTGGTFRVLVPPTAERHPIWRIAEDPQQNTAILAAMPQFYGTNLIDRVKPGATVLGLSDRPMPLAGVMPVFACQHVRPRANLRHDHRHHRPIGAGTLSRNGAKATTATSASSGGTSSSGSARTRSAEPSGCGSKPTRSSIAPANRSK